MRSRRVLSLAPLATAGVDDLLSSFAWALGPAPVGLSVLDPDGRLVRVNPALCGLLGRTEGELLGRSLGEVVTSAFRRAACEALHDVQAGPGVERADDERWQAATGHVDLHVVRICLAGDTGPYVLQHVVAPTAGGRDEALVRAAGLVRLWGALDAARGAGELSRLAVTGLVDLVAGGAAVFLVDAEDDSVLEAAAVRSFTGRGEAAVLRLLGLRPDRADTGVFGQALAGEGPLLLLPPFGAWHDEPPPYVPWLSSEPLSALLLVPLRSAGRVVGLLALVRGAGAAAYDADEVELVGRIAARLAALLAAAQHVRLEEVTARRAAAVSAVAQACDQVLSEPRRELATAVRAVSEVMGLPCLGWLVDELAPRLDRSAVHDDDPYARAVAERALEAPLAVGLLERVLREGRLHLSDPDDVRRMAPVGRAVPDTGDPGACALYGVRLQARGEVLGVLAVHDLSGPLSVEQRRLLDAVAERVALALDNAVLLHTARERADQQAVLAEIGAAALTLGLPELLDLVVDRVAGVLELPWCAVVQRGAAGEFVVRSRSPRMHGFPVGSRVSPAPSDGLAVAVRTGSPVIVPDYAQCDVVDERAPLASGVRSGALLPLQVDGAVWGAVTVFSPHPRWFSTVELGFFETLTTVLAVALERELVSARQLHDATHDTLTSLPNRALLRQDLHRALHAGARSVVALLLLDLDDFKDVNDSLGHGVGDDVLVQVGRRLQCAVGGDGGVARLGGDEFAICLTGCRTELEAIGVADRVVRAMHSPFALPGLDVTLSTSIGIAVCSGRVTDPELLLQHADMAMYRAKSGRTGWALYDPGLDRERSERLSLVTELRAVLREDGLVLRYQPLVDLRTGLVREVEALVRWPHPVRGLLPPGMFVPLAEQTGLVDLLTLQVARKAAAQAAAWRAQGRAVDIAINVSPVVLRHPDVWADLREVLCGAAGAVSVEVTESALVDSAAQAAVAVLASAGIRCAIDDFGTGYSALGGLKTLPVSRLKLDRDFTAGVDVDRRAGLLIGGAVQVAHSLGLDVVAEGVETEAVAQVLRALDVDVAQGFLYSHPVPAQDVPLDRVPVGVTLP